jgi:iron transport multicopper oxidase
MVLTVEDWYHTQAPYLINYYQSPLNEVVHGGSEPVPNATLINSGQNQHIDIQQGHTYLFRFINIGSFAAQYVQFDQHEMTVVEVDGIYVKPYKVDQLFLVSGQRYAVIVKAKSNSNKNYAIVASMNEDMFDPGVIPPGLKNTVSISMFINRIVANSSKVTAWLVYDKKKPLPDPFKLTGLPFDDTVFIPKDNQGPWGPVTNSYASLRRQLISPYTDI